MWQFTQSTIHFSIQDNAIKYITPHHKNDKSEEDFGGKNPPLRLNDKLHQLILIYLGIPAFSKFRVSY